MASSNEFGANRQSRQDPKVATSLDKELYSRMIDDAYNNALKGVGTFEATILDIKTRLLVTQDAAIEVTGVNAANFYEVILRPEWLNNIPAPWDMLDFVLAQGLDVIQGTAAVNAVKAHPTATTAAPPGNGPTSKLGIGDVVLCTFGDGVNNKGRYRDIRIDLQSVRTDKDLLVAVGGRGALQAHRSNVIGTIGTATATGTQGDPATFKWVGLHKGNAQAVGRPTKRKYIGTAVPSLKGQFLYNGALPPQYFSSFQIQLHVYKNGVSEPYKKPTTFKICADAFADFQRMNAAFKAEFGHDLPVSSINRTWQRQVATKNTSIKQNGGGLVAKPGNSKHGWGLAIDFKTASKKKQASKKYNKNNKYGYESTTHIWLKENGHKWNWVNPDWAKKGNKQAEPWHFEWVPRDTVLQGESAAVAWYSY